MQAKLMHQPFPSIATYMTIIRSLTYVDLWGKYDIKSIHSNQYYILLIDNYSCYMTIHFMKAKNQATQNIYDYSTLHVSQIKTLSHT